jgi:hypothetical protein
MKRIRSLFPILVLGVAAALLLAWHSNNPVPRVSRAMSAEANRGQALKHVQVPEQAVLIQSYGKLPLSFEPNRGQTDSRVNFLSRGGGYTLFLTGNEAVLSLGPQKRPVAERSFQKRIADEPSHFAGLPALLKKTQGLTAETALQEQTLPRLSVMSCA